MKPMHILMLAGIVLISPAASHAQVAGTTLLGVTVTELQEVTKGWSVKRTILGQPVYNDNKASERSMTSLSLQTRRFHMPSSMPAAFSAWRNTMSPYPFLSSSWSIRS
jgi:hypothetical protein